MDGLKSNIIVVICDQLKASALPMYGNVEVETPVLSKVSDEGVVFNNFYANCPLCVPSRGDLLSGVYSHNRRVRNNSHPVKPGDDNIVQRLRDVGYRTALVGKNHFCHDIEECGFDDFISCKYTSIYPEGITFHGRDTEEFSTSRVTESACAHIEGHQSSNPLFMIVSYPKPHTPYTVPEPYDTMYDPAEIDLPPSWDDSFQHKHPKHQSWKIASGMDELSEREKKELLAIYYGMISEIDDYLARLIKAAETLTGPVLFLFTSDHGDYMCEHGMIEKNASLYDALVHIPLIVWGNGVKRGGVSDALCEMVDIYPTIADIAGAKTPEYCNGKSLSGILEGKIATHREHAYAEWNFESDTYPKEWKWGDDNNTKNCFKAHGRLKSIRDDRWKLIYYADGYTELYDTIDDPWERCNRAGEKESAEVLLRLKEVLLKHLIESELKYPPLGRPIWCNSRGVVFDEDERGVLQGLTHAT